jgi:hypothetical protein
MRERRMTGLLTGGEISQARIGALMTGAVRAEVAA